VFGAKSDKIARKSLGKTSAMELDTSEVIKTREYFTQAIFDLNQDKKG